MTWDWENALSLWFWAGLGPIFQPNVCDLLCLTGKFTATPVHNKGPNALCVPDSDNSSHLVVTTSSAL